MLLVIDVGNTNLVLGVYKKDELIQNWRMATGGSRTSDEYGLMIKSLFIGSGLNIKGIQDVIISSVVPNIMYSLTNGIRKYLGIDPMMVSSDMNLNIKVIHDNPKGVGADRLVNAVAAYELYGGPAIVIDYGTANTFDVLTEKGVLTSGFITPGIIICAEELFLSASQIPKVEIKRPTSIITKDTVSSVQAGLIMGKTGETMYIIDCFKQNLNMPHAKVISTGGLAKVIDPDNTIYDVNDPILTLKGLKILYERNKGRDYLRAFYNDRIGTNNCSDK